jgi:hypothetical protein
MPIPYDVDPKLARTIKLDFGKLNSDFVASITLPWVKLRKTQYEQMSSGLPLKTDIPERGSRDRPLCADCVEKVENAASAKFAQRRADRRLRLAMPSQSMWEGR